MNAKRITVTIETEHGPITWTLEDAEVTYDVSREIRPKQQPDAKPGDWKRHEYTGVGAIAVTGRGQWKTAPAAIEGEAGCNAIDCPDCK